ncbi:MFS transporter [Fodinicola acaciae]|uniref:MFS transporter n=1 Tax=Fodinicola acaciae TaxID=2681555 RepID=UPI0013D77EB5|nr:MFS transporter [Fodinicola acaciae]
MTDARTATAVSYGLTGVLTALWAATLPATDVRLNLGSGRLGALLTGLAVGALVAMPVAGRLAGPRLLPVTAPAAAAALVVVALAPTVQVLAVAAVLLGAAFGALNVALSLRAVAVERAAGRPVMAWMHGVWTLGAVAGGAIASASLRAGLDVRVLMAGGAVAVAIAFASVTRVRVESVSLAAKGSPAPRSRLLVLLGVIGAAAFVSEGAATDWAGVHAVRVLGAEPSTGSLVYTVFFVAMTVVRLLGDAVRDRIGAAGTIGLAGGVATAGYALVLLSGAAPAGIRVGCAMVGWTLAGAGMAVVWPIVASAIGAAGGAGRLSAVTAISYGGGLVGPAVIGYVAAHATLPVGLSIPAVLALLVAAAAPAVLRQVGRPVLPLNTRRVP